ncbi:serine/threonine protein kinase [Pendulispora rubella]|uniref:non-specific serine/threonine protein kinase n=1 Tax=Pendulispora rubella TaxID=2741070 RepID=A0ABZ2LL21_9BACT
MMSSPVGAPGKYELLFELGRGGMSRIYLAVIRGPAGFSKLVVIKRLHEELASDPEFRTMFHEEARLSARLNHPNIVQVNEVGHDGVHFDIEMEYLEGHSLEAIIRRASSQSGRFPVALNLRILSDALAGLHYAHEFRDFEGQPLHLVHRDVSPHNIFVTYDGHVKLVDFGIAKAADSQQHTRTGVLKGKCAYMAPEQLLTLPIDRRIDIYAMGVMLWQVATERKLWKGMSDIEIFQRVAGGEIPRPSTVKPDVPPDLEAIVMKALARNADDRFSSAEELRFALNDYINAHSGRIDERDVSQYVTEMFQKERREIRSAIETQMRKETRSSQPVVPAIPRIPITTASGTMEVQSPFVTEAPRRKAGLAYAFGFLGLAAVAGGGGYYYLHHGDRTAPATPVGSAVPIPAAAPDAPGKDEKSPSTVAAVEYIELTVSGTPSDARFSVDDVRLSSNPARQQFVRDGKVHRIVGTAPGYGLAEQYVKFTAPTGSVQLTLTKTAPAAAPYRPARTSGKAPVESNNDNTPAPPPAVAPPPPAPTPSPAPPTKKTSIDQDNPYAK